MNNLGRTLIIVILAAVIGLGAWLIFRPGSGLPGGLGELKLPTDAAAQQSAQPIITGKVGLVTPWAGGHILVNKNNRAVQYLSAAGQVTDLSPMFGLSTENVAAEDEAAYSGVLDIISLKDGSVAVITNRALFLATSPDAIEELLSPKIGATIASAAYDSSTNSLLVIAAYDNHLYRYDLAKPEAEPTAVFESKLNLNRVAASGGQALVYYDNFPSTEGSVLASYKEKYQIVPQLVNLQSKTAQSLDQFTGITFAAFSSSGKYLAVKKKFSTNFIAYELANKKSKEFPGADTGGAAWQGDSLNFGRETTVWAYDAVNAGFTKLATLDAAITAITPAASGTLVATNTNAIIKLVSAGTSPAGQVINFPNVPGAVPYLYAGGPEGAHEHE